MEDESENETKINTNTSTNTNKNKSIFDQCVPKSWLEEGSFWNHPAGE